MSTKSALSGTSKNPGPSRDLSPTQSVGAVVAGVLVLVAVVAFSRLPSAEASPEVAETSSASPADDAAVRAASASVAACRAADAGLAASGFDALLGDLTQAAGDAQAYYDDLDDYGPTDYFNDELSFLEPEPVITAATQATRAAATTPELPESTYEALVAQTGRLAELRSTLRSFFDLDQVDGALAAVRGVITTTDEVCAPPT